MAVFSVSCFCCAWGLFDVMEYHLFTFAEFSLSVAFLCCLCSLLSVKHVDMLAKCRRLSLMAEILLTVGMRYIICLLLYHQCFLPVWLSKTHLQKHIVLSMVAHTFHSSTWVTKAGDHEPKTTLVYIAGATRETETLKHCFRPFLTLCHQHLLIHLLNNPSRCSKG